MIEIPKLEIANVNGVDLIVGDDGMGLLGVEQLAEVIRRAEAYEGLVEKYKDYEYLWEIAEKSFYECDGDCDEKPPHKACAQCIAKSAINQSWEIVHDMIPEIKQALAGEQK